jgi:hypothetical protein
MKQGLKAPTRPTGSTSEQIEAYEDYQAHGGATELGNGIWDTWGTVNAQNVYGAQVRLDWRLVFVQEPAEILYAKLGNTVQGDYDAALKRARAH